MDLDSLHEIAHTFRMNKLRTILTGFTVAWGIFMLIILLGSGNGIETGVKREFERDAVNAIWMSGGKTSLPYKGLKPGKPIQLDNTDYHAVKRSVDRVEHISSRYYLWRNHSIAYRNQFGIFTVIGCHPDHLHLEKTVITDGRMINAIDIQHKRKVVIIGIQVRDHLFGEESPIGKRILINNLLFTVVGVFTDEMDERQERIIYTPISTAQQLFNGQNKVHSILFTTRHATLEENRMAEQEAFDLMARRHQFSREDKSAVHIWSNFEMYKKYVNLFKNIRTFIWIIGVGTIIAGIVAVSNIMLISVRERIKEIGIRKAIGARPRAIVGQILAESIFLTSFFGYVGLVAGIGVLELVAANLPPVPYFHNPQVDISIAISAVLMLIMAGTLAGYIPAKKAAGIRPIEALKDQ